MEFHAPTIIANGLSPLGDAARLALIKIEEQKARYRANGIKYKRPWLFLHTDGEATDEGWELAAADCYAAEQAKLARRARPPDDLVVRVIDLQEQFRRHHIFIDIADLLTQPRLSALRSAILMTK